MLSWKMRGLETNVIERHVDLDPRATSPTWICRDWWLLVSSYRMVYIWRRIICFTASSKLGIASYLSCSRDTPDTSTAIPIVLLYSTFLLGGTFTQVSLFFFSSFFYLAPFLGSFSCPFNRLYIYLYPLLCRVASHLLFYALLCLLSVLSPTFQFFRLYRTFCCLEIQFLYSDVALFLIYLFRFSWSLLCHLFLSNSSLSWGLHDAARSIVCLDKEYLSRDFWS